jgi:hypothetical protein
MALRTIGSALRNSKSGSKDHAEGIAHARRAGSMKQNKSRREFNGKNENSQY